MASLEYSGSYSGTDGLNAARTVNLSKSAGDISNYGINSVVASIYCSTTQAKNFSVTVTTQNASGTATLTFGDGEYTGKWFDIALSTESGFNPNGISSMTIKANNDGSKIFLKSNTMKLTIGYTQYSSCSAPTSVSAPATGAPGGSVTVSWSGASAGSGMSISGYDVYRAEAADGTYSYRGHASGTSFNDSNLPTNKTVYYKVVACSSVSSSYNSGMSGASSGTACYYGTCTAPSTVSAPATAAPSDGVPVTWSGASAGTNVSISRYDVYRSTAADGEYTKIGQSTSQSYTDTSVTGGGYFYYKIKSIASVSGYDSDLSAATGGTKVNSIPTDPILVGNGKTIYNTRPRILCTAGTDLDGDSMAISCTGYTPSRASVTSAAKIVLRRQAAVVPGVQEVTVTNTDPDAGSGSAAISFTIAAPVWTDDPIVSGTTKIKAVHINEIRDILDDICDYYGLEPTDWGGAVVAGVTQSTYWLEHITAIKNTINRIVNYVNSWDTESATNRIILPAYVNAMRPSAEAMNQIRDIIEML